jgi:hypothetical protein
MRKMLLFAAGVLVSSSLGCQDLAVTNPNNPDRAVVVTSPDDVEALLASSFRRWFNMAHGGTPSIAMSNMADEFSSGFFDFGAQDQGREPRQPINNHALAPNSPNRAPISTLYSIIGGVNIGLQAIQNHDLRILQGTVDVTSRAQAFGKFVQGLSHSYAALLYDRSWVYSETVDTDTIRFAPGFTHVQDLVRPYTEVRDTAIAQLEAAIQIAETSSFTLPGDVAGDWMLGQTMSNQEFARVVHSYIARTIAYTPRTPQEAAQVDWQRVIEHIDQGINEDFAPQGTPGVVTSIYKHRAARHRTVTPGDFMRVSYWLVGPADQGSGFMTWVSRPWEERAPFVMQGVVDQRIISSPTAACTSSQAVALANEGNYMGCHVANVFAADRGLARRSYYYYHRLGRFAAWETGPLPIMTVAEMNLLKAEALIRLNRAEEAVPLINITRVGHGGLPPVTADGVPDPSCTPRKLDGTCGSLWDALRYEKKMEMIGVDGGVSWWDARRWGALAENTPLHFPMPGNELELMDWEMYTFGGGLAGSAPPRNAEQCPVALPRCP